MSSFLNEVDAEEPDKVPAAYKQHAEWDSETGNGTAATGAVRKIVSDERELLALAGLDPDTWRITGRISQWTKTHHGKEDTYSFFFPFSKIRPDNDTARDLAKLIRPVKPVRPASATGLPMVVCLADAQIGKDGPDSSGPEVMDALFHRALAKVAGLVKERKPSILILADNGDPVEGITSSAPNQIATNTLEFQDQLRLWHRRLTESILSLSRFAGRTIVAAVPSNHGEIRNPSGKVGYGDHGLGVAETVRDAFDLHRPDHGIEFLFPATKYDVVTYVDVDGTRVAFTHGHHSRSIDAFPQWVANQAASLRSPMAGARIVCHGHYHQPGYKWTRGREIVSCPMFDSGSAWFENRTGEYSFPAIATFSIRDSRVHELRFIEP